MEAIVLAGGLGTRLRSPVPDLPKPMAPVDGRPFLEFVLDSLVNSAFDRAVLATGYRHEVISKHFGARYRSLSLAYSVEQQALGTGGAILLALSHTTAAHVFVLNGDTFVMVDHSRMLAAHRAAGATATMAIARVADAGRYGSVHIDGDIVQGFREKGETGEGWINAGIYVIDTRLRERLGEVRPFSFEQEVLVREAAEGRLRAFPASGGFIDIGVPEDYARAQSLFRSRHRNR